MSGGHFDYKQYQIHQCADEVEQLIRTNDSTEKDEWGYDKGHHYSEETIEMFKKGKEYLRLAAIYLHRIDWLVSGDDGEDSLHKRLKEDLEGIR